MKKIFFSFIALTIVTVHAGERITNIPDDLGLPRIPTGERSERHRLIGSNGDVVQSFGELGITPTEAILHTFRITCAYSGRADRTTGLCERLILNGLDMAMLTPGDPKKDDSPVLLMTKFNPDLQADNLTKNPLVDRLAHELASTLAFADTRARFIGEEFDPTQFIDLDSHTSCHLTDSLDKAIHGDATAVCLTTATIGEYKDAGNHALVKTIRRFIDKTVPEAIDGVKQQVMDIATKRFALKQRETVMQAAIRNFIRHASA